MTPQDKIQIFHAYNGAMVKAYHHDGIFRIDEHDNKHRQLTLCEVKHSDNVHIHIEYCHLLLTDLSLITDEHLIDVAKMAIGDTEDGYRFIVNDNPDRFGFAGEMHKDIKCVGVEWFCKHPDIMEYRPTYLIQLDTVDFDVVKGYYNVDDGYSDDIPDNIVPVIDTLRKLNYNIGYGKYTAQDLVNEGVVIIDTKNKGI